MPTYRVTAPDGRSVRLTGDSPPTEAELEEIFAKLPPEALAGAAAPSGAESIAPVSAPEPERSALSRFITGAAKQAPLTAMDVAQSTGHPINIGLDKLAEFLGLGETARRAREIREKPERYMRAPFEPTEEEGTAGAIGRGITKAAPQAALAALTAGASIPIQAGVQGIGQAAQTVAEGGSAEEVAATGVLGAGLGAAAPGVAAGAKSLAPRIINSLIKPLSKAFRFGRDPGRGVVSEGIVARSASQFVEKLSQKLDSIGGEIKSLLTRGDVAAKTIDITPALREVDKAIVAGAKTGEKALVNRLKDLKQALTQELDPATGEFGLLKPTMLSPKAAHQLKVEIGRASKWTGQAFDNEVNQVRVAVYRALNNMIDKAAPGAKKLQARYADMLTAQSSLERTMTIQARQNIVSLPNILMGGGGYAAGGPAGLILAAGARKAAGTTPAKTGMAWLLGRTPNVSPALQGALRAKASEDR